MADYPIHTYPNVPVGIEKARVEEFLQFRESALPARFASDPLIALQIALVEGHQWIYEQRHSATSSKGRRILHMLPESGDPAADNVRVTLNRIRDLTEEVAAILRIDPQGWQGSFQPDPRDPVGSHTELRIERSIWRDYIDTVDIHTESVLMTEWQAQCGTGLLKAIPDTRNPYGWTLASIPLDRILWDSAVKTPNFALHKRWADSCAWAAHDVERAYGIRFKEPKRLPTLGQLRAFEMTINTIRGLPGLSSGESKTPAVLLTEFYDDWSDRLTILIHSGTTTEQAKVMWDGPNPYGKCPLLQRNLGTSLVSPLGIGIPIRLKADQNILNQAMTSIIRHLLTSAGRWMYEQGSVTNPLVAFSPRVGAPLEWTPQRGDKGFPPQLVGPGEPSAIASQIVSAIPTIMGEKIHVMPVMQGVTSPRGESRAAIVEKLAQAGRVYAAGAETDEDRIKRFLTHHARFICNQVDKRRHIFRMAGEDVKQVVLKRYEMVDAGEAEALIDAKVTVSLPPGASQPKTPTEKEDRLLKLASMELLSPETLRHELYKQTGMAVTTDQEMSIANAAEENRMFLGGAVAEMQEGVPPEQLVDAKNFESHDEHIFVHRMLINSRHTMGISDEVVREVQLHIADHADEKSEEAFQAFAISAAGQGQPGFMEGANQNLLAETPMSGSLSAPPATEEQYGLRDDANRIKQDRALA